MSGLTYYRLRRLDWLSMLMVLTVLGMEACWLSPWIPLLDPLMGVDSRNHSALGVYAFFSVAFFGVWAVRSTRLSTILQRLLLAVLMLVTTLGFVRYELYSDYPLLSLDWVRQIISSLAAFPPRVPPEAFLFAVALYVWNRGVLMNETSQATQMVAARFRWGFLALALYAYTAWLNQIAMPWELFAFFSLGMIAVAAARLMESDVRIRNWNMAWRWAGMLLASAGLTLVLGLGALLFLSPDNLTRAGRMVAPIFRWLGYVVSYVVSLVTYALYQILARLAELGGRARMPTISSPQLPSFTDPEAIEATSSALSPLWVNVGRATVLLLALLLLALVMRRIRRRRDARAWDEGVERESLAVRRRGFKEGVEQGWQRVVQTLKRIRLTPNYSTESIRRAYASLVAYADELGHPRGDDETPFEFLPTLEGLFAEGNDEVSLITDAYVRIHYGEAPEDPDELERVRASWDRLREIESNGDSE